MLYSPPLAQRLKDGIVGFIAGLEIFHQGLAVPLFPFDLSQESTALHESLYLGALRKFFFHLYCLWYYNI